MCTVYMYFICRTVLNKSSQRDTRIFNIWEDAYQESSFKRKAEYQSHLMHGYIAIESIYSKYGYLCNACEKRTECTMHNSAHSEKKEPSASQTEHKPIKMYSICALLFFLSQRFVLFAVCGFACAKYLLCIFIFKLVYTVLANVLRCKICTGNQVQFMDSRWILQLPL